MRKKKSIRTGIPYSKPMQISIQPNLACNARCLMCDCWHEKTNYLTSAELIKTLKEMREWMGPDFFIQIAGGEPLIFPGMYDIFRFCADNQIICKINTNGIAFTERICQRIIDSGLKYLTVSIDSHKAEIHDKYRGVPGTFERAEFGLKYLKKNSKMVLGVSVVLMKENVKDIREMTEYFLSLGVDRVLYQPIRVFTNDIPTWKDYEFWPDDIEALRDGIGWLKEMHKADSRIMNTEDHLDMMLEYFTHPESIINRKNCYIGFDQITINYKGEVFLCDAFGTIGNIKDGNVKDMWNSDKAKRVRKAMETCKFPCTSNCKKELTFGQKVSKFWAFYKAGMFKK
ncbi:MAG: radical SAM protein [Bacteroidota bacterium]